MLEGFSSNDIECETKAAVISEFFFLKLEVVSACISVAFQ